MKKIVNARKKLRCFSAGLALATILSGCSFNGSNDLTKDDDAIIHEIVENEVERKDIVVEDADALEETSVPEEKAKLDEDDSEIEEPSSVEDELARKTLNYEKVEEEKNEEVSTIDLEQECYIVMFEGEELVIPNLSRQYRSGAYTKFSIELALGKAGFENNYAYRAKLAKFFNIKNYRGKPSQNILLLTILRNPEKYLDMSLVINNEETKTNEETQIVQNNQNSQNENDNNNENNGNNGGDNNQDHSHEEDKGHECNYGSLIVEYSNITDTTHTVTKYRVCNTCGKKWIISKLAENHNFKWSVVGNKDVGTCACGYSVEKDKEHVHGDWKTVDERYEALDNGKHKIIYIQQCQVLKDGQPCTETREEDGPIVDCVYDANDNCVCGNIKNHVHGDWEVVGTKLVSVDATHHRVDTTYKCTVLKNGKECTYTKVEQGKPVDCEWNENNNTKCPCGNTHEHHYTYVYFDNEYEEGTCDVCHTKDKRKHPATGLVETTTDVIVYYDADGHKYEVTVYCPSCKSYLDSITSDLIAHTSVTSEWKYDENGHWKNKTIDCDDCNYHSSERVNEGSHAHEDGARISCTPNDDGKTHTSVYAPKCECGHTTAQKTVTGDCVNVDGKCRDCERDMTHSCTPDESAWTQSSKYEASKYCYYDQTTCAVDGCGKILERYFLHGNYKRVEATVDTDKIVCGYCGDALLEGIDLDAPITFDGITFTPADTITKDSTSPSTTNITLVDLNSETDETSLTGSNEAAIGEEVETEETTETQETTEVTEVTDEQETTEERKEEEVQTEDDPKEEYQEAVNEYLQTVEELVAKPEEEKQEQGKMLALENEQK